MVEGKSEKNALELAFSDMIEAIDNSILVFFPRIRVESEDVGGDITTQKGIWPRKIEKEIYDQFLYDFFDEYKLYPKDITEVIHIVDMDGAYIPDNCVIAGEERICYQNDVIVTYQPERIKKRNEQKRENLDYLSSLDYISLRQKKVKYSVYYFSSNLDHVLHNNANLDGRLKAELAEDFSLKFDNNIDGMESFFMDLDSDTKDMSYEESWQFIKEGTNSLKRHTNIGILIRRLKE